MLTFIECKVRSTRDQSLYTGAEHYELIEGEVFVGAFKSIATLEAFEDAGLIEVVDESVPCSKSVPVISLGSTKPTALRTDTGVELPLSGWLED